MNEIEFRNYIESIGFKEITIFRYEYGDFSIQLYNDEGRYYYHDGSLWIKCYFDDLTPILKYARSHKLKNILK